MLRLKPVNRDNDEQVINLTSRLRNLAHGACYKLNCYAHPAQLRQQNIKLAKSHKRLPAYNGDVQGAIAARKRQDAINQLLALIIRQRSARPKLVKMFRLVSITTRTAKRTFARYLY